ncbi:MAG: beta-mannosidase [Sphingobacteriaceae bacterium]|nr:MAG: beta-mannosidase [Sphingobacteriaceae bacterium]
MKKQLIGIALIAICLTSCEKAVVNKQSVSALSNTNNVSESFTVTPANAVTPIDPIDGSATLQTRNLLRKLQKTSQTGVMFGHWDDRIQGVTWTYDANRSDVKSLVNEYPAVVGHELGNLEISLTYNADGLNFQKIKESIQAQYRAGGMVTLLWACRNPVDTTQGRKTTTIDSTIRTMFKPGNEAYLQRYCRWMDKLATFIKGLKGDNGEAIPIVFRTLHEQNGGWYWWGATHCKPYEYVTMWRYTVNYLRYNAAVHNLLYVYCPTSFASKAAYTERYPGDNYIDILGADIYDATYNHSTFVTRVDTMVQTMKSLAKTSNKPFAITETGVNLVPYSNWWTATLKPIVKNSGMAWVMAWRNARADTYYCAYPEQSSAADFETFHSDTTMYFINKAASKQLYQP